MISASAYLLPVHNVPLLCSFITINNISSHKVTITIPGLCVGFRVIEIPLNYGRSPYTEFSSDIEVGNVITVIINQPVELVIFFGIKGSNNSLDICIRHESIANTARFILIRIVEKRNKSRGLRHAQNLSKFTLWCTQSFKLSPRVLI